MRRIQRDVCHEDFIKELISGDKSIFKEIWKVLLFAAALGIKDGKRKPLCKIDSGKSFPDTYFSTPGWRGFLYLIRISETGSSDCLRGIPEEQEELAKAFEEYANNGLYILGERLKSCGNQFDEIVSLLLETEQGVVTTPNLDDLI